MNKKLILGLFAIGISLILALTGAPLASNTVAVQQIDQNLENYQDKEIKVKGIIKTNSIEQNGEGTTFILEDKNNPNYEITVKNNKPVPTQNDEGKTTEITGKMNSNNVLIAENVEIGCKNSYN